MNNLSNKDFIGELRRKLETTSNSTEDIDKIINKVELQHNDLDHIFKCKGWRYLRNRYLSEYPIDRIFFYKSGMGYNCMCIQTQIPDIYTVTFTFIHDLDIENICKDYKKYCIYNYIKNKYTYNVKATSFINAICIANNKNYLEFPKNRQYRTVPELSWHSRGDNMPENSSLMNKPDYFDNPYDKYINIRQKLLDQGYDHSDIRYYMCDYDFGILVLRKDNKYKVIFSFVNPEDYEHVISLNNKGDYKHISRYCLINNYLNNKYCYDCDHARNSISAAYYAFNDHTKEFPGRFKNTKIYIEIRHYIDD